MPDEEKEQIERWEMFIGCIEFAESALCEAFVQMRDASIIAQLIESKENEKPLSFIGKQETNKTIVLREQTKAFRDILMHFTDDMKDILGSTSRLLPTRKNTGSIVKLERKKTMPDELKTYTMTGKEIFCFLCHLDTDADFPCVEYDEEFEKFLKDFYAKLEAHRKAKVVDYVR